MTEESDHTAVSIVSQHYSESEVIKSNEWEKLEVLKRLYDQGYIKRDEYDLRMNQLINTLTGTSNLNTSGLKHSNEDIHKSEMYINEMSIVLPGPPPSSFSALPIEHAKKLMFTIDEHGIKKWISSDILVRLCPNPFSQGSLRRVYHMMEYEDINETEPHPTERGLFSQEEVSIYGDRVSYVAKFNRDERISNSTYFNDTEMQTICGYYAEAFNSYHPPRSVVFNEVWVIQLVDRKEQPYACVERFMNGKYTKHNNNNGFVSENERNTPQAFSHFTYEVSGGDLVVVDIQGVGNLYTDPQIHSNSCNAYGQGNLGKHGIESFLATHRCNAICSFLKLMPVNPNMKRNGTVPSNPVMAANHIQIKTLENSDNACIPLLHSPSSDHSCVCNGEMADEKPKRNPFTCCWP